jgi:hypothetical protein|tara:strand:- start:168 stop:374 length:207 start_codon:yes stop_codon:yes gene_type:complete
MAKYDLKFLDATGDNSHIKCESVEDPDTGEEFICIASFNHGNTVVWLDKSTAIKFAKTLRTEINKIQD